MRLFEQLNSETEEFHAEADGDSLGLLRTIGVADYWHHLVRTYGFVAPVERAIVQAPAIADALDVRRFHKHNLLRQDLLEFGMQPDEIERLPQCPVPVFELAEHALGWAYVVERGTLGHTSLFRHLAMVMPGQIAFTSAYLKCYFGALGDMWRSFGIAIDRFSDPPRAERVIEAAKSAFRALRTWHHDHDFEHEPASETGGQKSA